MLKEISVDGHKRVLYYHDKESGLRVIVALHRMINGLAMGATRMWPYTENEALDDALRLSRGMTYKAACANIPAGGGKAVILGSPQTKTIELLYAYGRFLNTLKGQFVTGQDVNLSIEDVRTIAETTSHVVGITGNDGGPVSATAIGVLHGILSAISFKLKCTTAKNLRVAIQGLGGVGKELCLKLHALGAQLTITDIDLKKVKEVATLTGAQVVSPEDIYAVDADIFAPCALGAILNDSTIPLLKAKIVAGSANNQLADEAAHSLLLKQADILYCPDYIINAGGLINVYHEMIGYDENRVSAHILSLAETLTRVFMIAEKTDVTTVDAAEALGNERIESMHSSNVIYDKSEQTLLKESL